MVVNQDHEILEVHGDVRLYLTLVPGNTQNNLLRMLNTELQFSVRTTLRECITNRSSANTGIKRFNLFETEYFVKIIAKPLIYTNTTDELFVVIFERMDIESFIDKTQIAVTEDIITDRINELENELAATKEHLQTYIEEIETTNEELQSLNEELQSSNEELQSSNEELETTNEEMQSTNEEIQVAYAQLKITKEELEQKEESLIEKDAFSQALINNRLQAFILLDHKYRVLSFNKLASETFLKIRNKQIQTGETLIDLIPPSHLETIITDLNHAFEGQQVSNITSITDALGKTLWFNLNYTPALLENKMVSCISLSMLDITDTKKANEELQATKELLESVFNATSIGICVIDEAGNFVNLNENFCKIYGYTRQDLIGSPSRYLIGSKIRNASSQASSPFMKPGVVEHLEEQFFRKDGNYITVSASVESLVLPDEKHYLVISVQDITEKKRTARDMALMIDNTDEAFILLNKELNIISMNKMFENLYLEYLGVKVTIGDSILNFAVAGQRHELAARYERVLRGNTESADITIQALDGRLLNFNMKYRPARDEEGHLIGVFVNAADATEKKAAQSLLEANEKRFRSLVENGADGIAIMSPEGVPLYLSPSIKRILGYEVEDLIGKPIQDIFHPDEHETIAHKVAQAMAFPGIPTAIHSNRARHKDGTWRWLESTLTNLNDDPAIGGVVDNFRDVTETMISKLALEKSQAELKKIMDSSLDVICTLQADGRFIQVSAAAEEVWGYLPEELYGKQQLDLVDPEDLEKTTEAMALIMAGTSMTNFENRYIRSNGDAVPLIWSFFWDKHDQVMYCIAKDATERQKAEESLKESENKYRTLFHASPLPKWIFDLETLAILDSNNSAIEHYGYSYQEFLGMSVLNLSIPQELDNAKEWLTADPSDNEATKSYLLTHRKKNGEQIQVEMRSNVLTFEGRKAKIIIANDITEREQYIGAINIQNVKLREIAWIQSHVVRAPLARMMGLVDLLHILKGDKSETEMLMQNFFESANELDLIIGEISAKSAQVSFEVDLPNV